MVLETRDGELKWTLNFCIIYEALSITPSTFWSNPLKSPALTVDLNINHWNRSIIARFAVKLIQGLVQVLRHIEKELSASLGDVHKLANALKVGE